MNQSTYNDPEITAIMGLKTPIFFFPVTLFGCQRACARQPPDILKKYANADRRGFLRPLGVGVF